MGDLIAPVLSNLSGTVKSIFMSAPPESGNLGGTDDIV
jgi:hypothetical protein